MGLRSLRRPGFVLFAHLAAGCSHANTLVSHTEPAAEDAGLHCVGAVVPLVPREATSWLFVRPRVMFEHPRIGRALGHALADDGERALMLRSQRLGYDLRTVERAVIAWAPRGWVAIAIGSFDGAQIIERIWERMLTPRRRASIGARALRAEGMIAEVPVAVAIEQGCGVAAYAEGDTRRCDRAIAPPSTAVGDDPPEWLEWRARELPGSVLEGDALIHRMHDLRLTARSHMEGMALSLTLRGDAPADGAQRVQRAAEIFAASELGDLIGASDWMRGERLTVEGDPHEIRAMLVIPFRGLEALAEVVRGRVGEL